MNKRCYRFACAAVVTALLLLLPRVQPAVVADEDLTQLSMEDLTKVQVMSFSKRSASLSSTPAAVFVITREDIERSGLSSIAELLRLVPGMQVARSNAHTWVISARGFADDFSSKLLVMIDGRSVYSPLHAGVHWNIQDLLIEDIDRIEVIRGPGGAIWGANAVNGVVNIITKDASDTTGTLTPVETSTTGNAYALRYGSGGSGKPSLRIFAKQLSVGDFPTVNTTKEQTDAYDQSRAGFRYDIDLASSKRLSVQGDVYSGEGNNNPWTRDVSTQVSGGDLMVTLYTSRTENSDSVLQMYYDRTEHVDPVLNYRTGTVDMDYTHRRQLSPSREFTWGLGYRSISDRITPTLNVRPEDESTTYTIFSGFVQEDRQVSKNGLRIVAGSKFEHNSYTGFEVQPSIRALLPTGGDSSVWASVSRSVRTPSRIETGLSLQFDPKYLPDGTPVVQRTSPDPDFVSESMTSYELGYRTGKGRWALDIAAYHDQYRDLRSLEVGTPFAEMSPLPPHYVIPLSLKNKLSGSIYGLEVHADWRASHNWRLTAGCTWQNSKLALDPASTDTYSLDQYECNFPNTQTVLQSRWSVNDKLDLDALYFSAGELLQNHIPEYSRFDLRLGWRAADQTRIVLGVQNVFDQYHSEWDDNTVIPRTVYLKVVRGM